jgi:tellurite resistance protein TerC
VVHRFVYLKYGLAAVLVFVGAKMMLVDVYKVPVAGSLAVVGTLIGASIAASLLRSPAPGARVGSGPPGGAPPGGGPPASGLSGDALVGRAQTGSAGAD